MRFKKKLWSPKTSVSLIKCEKNSRLHLTPKTRRHVQRANFIQSHSLPLLKVKVNMTIQRCKQIRCRHKGLPISIDKFRKSDSKPHCYQFHTTCNDCRTRKNRIAEAYSLPEHFTPPSPPTASRRTCRKCKQKWSVQRFLDNSGQEYTTCIFCRTSRNGSIPFKFY